MRNDNRLAHTHLCLSPRQRIVDDDRIRISRREIPAFDNFQIQELRIRGQRNNSETILMERGLSHKPSFGPRNARRVVNHLLNLL